MSDKKLGQGSAFPSFEQDESWKIPAYRPIPGMSKRLYIATMVMQGVLAGRTNTMFDSMSEARISKFAYKVADELLKQELE